MSAEDTTKGIFDRILFFLAPSSPLRSDRVMGSLSLLATLVATVAKISDTQGFVDFVTQTATGLFDATHAVFAALSALVIAVGVARRKISARSF